ncbi:MAG TPA: patatin-like phospholipase family protein, partial [Verrucomicrobiae bacterium]|nr:patatin-like phospholipase family protein [Verrucomicrobiae bacterium]
MNGAVPFPRIGLSCSGGGYRAAAFHLGALEFLHEAGLLPNVRALSTVSGGTITGVAYTLSLKDGQTFPEFRDGFKRWLTNTELVRVALQNLAAGQPGKKPEGPWTVIRSCAELYSGELTKGRTFGALWEGPAMHLEDVCYNATEFRTGNSFRFRYTLSPGNHVIGNRNVPIKREWAREIRLADIIASSSCFPGGFEPLGFPYEYAWPDTESGRAARDGLCAQFPKALPLMDGGVYDNQGMESLIPLEPEEQKKYDLFIFSDVYQLTPELFALDDWPYHSPDQGPKNYQAGDWLTRWFFRRTLNDVNMLLIEAMIIAALTAVGAFWGAWRLWGRDVAALACVFSGIVITLLAGMIGAARH